MSEIKVNKITPRVACGTTQLGDSGDTFTVPSGATIQNLGTATGFGATGETSWDTTVKTTGTFTATAGVGYFLNTTGGTITVNLPVGAAGSSVAMADYAGTWQTNNVTVAANGTEKIGGVDAGVTLNTEGQAVTFVYIDGTQGWVNVLDSTSNVRGNSYVEATVSGACNTLVTAPDCANAKVATFKGPGTFNVTNAAVCAADNVVSYVVVAGGGGGGNGFNCGYCGGGGGAGGYREVKSPVTPYTASPLDGYPNAPNRITVSTTPYSIVVGGGGAGSSCTGGNAGVIGNVSSFSTVPSAGGGAGGGGCRTACGNAGAGGSGGGGGAGAGYPGPAAGVGGAGNTPPVSPSQGFAGGSTTGGAAGFGGGGGGATAVGGNGSSPPATGGPGGAGTTSSIDATPTARGGGGGGSGYGPTLVPGGVGGGGNGAKGPTSLAATVGTVNTGGGGGGGQSIPTNATAGPGAAGGSGIVIIRYKFQ